MDWTTNPLVALYFAARETKTDENDKPTNSGVYVLTSQPLRHSDLMQEKARRNQTRSQINTPFEISENVIYDPPHVSPRIRAQDGVLLACHQPMQPLEEKDYIEIVIKHEAHDDIRHHRTPS